MRSWVGEALANEAVVLETLYEIVPKFRQDSLRKQMLIRTLHRVIAQRTAMANGASLEKDPIVVAGSAWGPAPMDAKTLVATLNRRVPLYF